jgi:hypothetical protein
MLSAIGRRPLAILLTDGRAPPKMLRSCGRVSNFLFAGLWQWQTRLILVGGICSRVGIELSINFRRIQARS